MNSLKSSFVVVFLLSGIQLHRSFPSCGILVFGNSTWWEATATTTSSYFLHETGCQVSMSSQRWPCFIYFRHVSRQKVYKLKCSIKQIIYLATTLRKKVWSACFYKHCDLGTCSLHLTGIRFHCRNSPSKNFSNGKAFSMGIGCTLLWIQEMLILSWSSYLYHCLNSSSSPCGQCG